MPPSISELRRRRAPAIDAAKAPLAVTNAARIRNRPMEDIERVWSKTSECARGSRPPASRDLYFDGVYFDGHLAITESARNPSGVSRPVSTTSEPFLNVSGMSAP